MAADEEGREPQGDRHAMPLPHRRLGIEQDRDQAGMSQGEKSCQEGGAVGSHQAHPLALRHVVQVACDDESGHRIQLAHRATLGRRSDQDPCGTPTSCRFKRQDDRVTPHGTGAHYIDAPPPDFSLESQGIEDNIVAPDGNPPYE